MDFITFILDLFTAFDSGDNIVWGTGAVHTSQSTAALLE
jgi:hypothetical protein